MYVYKNVHLHGKDHDWSIAWSKELLVFSSGCFSCNFCWSSFTPAGFTALCEKYCNSADKKSSGTDQLTTTLNSYLSKIVEGVSCHVVPLVCHVMSRCPSGLSCHVMLSLWSVMPCHVVPLVCHAMWLALQCLSGPVSTCSHYCSWGWCHQVCWRCYPGLLVLCQVWGCADSPPCLDKVPQAAERLWPLQDSRR